jgi:uncharacterized membrane protein YobD (UPF0266 family)
MPENKELAVDPDINYNKALLEWKTPEFIPLKRGPVWYTVASVIVISLVAYAIFTDSATMAIVFILIAGMFFMTHKKKPRIVDVRITKLGVFYDKTFYHYSAINAFWVVYHPPYVRVLYLRLGGKTYRLIKIELNHQDPTEVRHLLSKEIPEIEGMEERGFDMLVRVLRLQ